MITWLKKLFVKEISVKDSRMAIPRNSNVGVHNVFCLLWHRIKGGLVLHQLVETTPSKFIWFPVLDGRLVTNSYDFTHEIWRHKNYSNKVYIKIPSKHFLTNPQQYVEELEVFRTKHAQRIISERANSPYRCVRAGFTIPQSPTPPNSRIWVDSDLATKNPMDPKYKNALEELNALVERKRNDPR